MTQERATTLLKRQVEKELPPTTQNLLRTEIHRKKKPYPGSRNRMWRIIPTVNFTGPESPQGQTSGRFMRHFLDWINWGGKTLAMRLMPFRGLGSWTK